MRYNIHGFNQETAINLGLGNDELLILRWFIDFKEGGKMKDYILNGDMYYWVDYGYVLECLPILNFKTLKSVANKFNKLVKAKVLKKYLYKFGGTFVYYAIDENYDKLTKKDNQNHILQQKNISLVQKNISLVQNDISLEDKNISEQQKINSEQKNFISEQQKINSEQKKNNSFDNGKIFPTKDSSIIDYNNNNIYRTSARYDTDVKENDISITDAKQESAISKIEQTENEICAVKEKNKKAEAEHLEKQCEEIWELYPNKKGKGVAMQKLKKHIKKYGFDEMKLATERFAKEMVKEKRDKKYMPHGGTFYHLGFIDYLSKNYLTQNANTVKIKTNEVNFGQSKKVKREEFEEFDGRYKVDNTFKPFKRRDDY